MIDIIYELKDELRLATARGSYHQGSEGMFKREHDLLSVSLDFCEIVLLFGVARWLSGRASDLRSSSRGFEARPRRCCVTTLGKLFTPYCLCHQAV